MEEYFIRDSDAAFGIATVFLFGIVAATVGWDVGLIFLCLCGVAAAAFFYFPGSPSPAFYLLIAGSLFIFPASVFYYHLRTPALASTGSPSFAGAATVNPFLARANAVFEDALPYRQASLLSGIVSGSTTVLAPDVKSSMSQSGTSYIIGMYGYKIYLLSKTIRAICKRFLSRRAASLVALVAIASFIAVANAPISALRAGIMAGLAMLAETSGRKFNARVALMFTAVIMALFDPSILTSGGFLLSFMSLVGIYALAPSLNTLLKPLGGEDGGLRAWQSDLVTSVAVNLAIMPIVVAMYGDFPAISFVSNFLIALPFGAVIALGITLAVTESFFHAATMIFVPILNALLSYQLLVIKIFASFAWPVPAWFASPIAITAYYAVLAWSAFHVASHVREQTSITRSA